MRGRIEPLTGTPCASHPDRPAVVVLAETEGKIIEIIDALCAECDS